MKTYFVISLLIVSASLVAQDLQSDKQKLRYLKEVEWPKAYREQDTVLLNRILADEFQMIDASGGVSTKKLELDYIKKNKPSYSSFVFTINRLDVFENGTAVVSGTGLIKGKGKEGDYETTYQSSNVFIKRNGLWKAISSHVSGVKRR